MVLVEGTQIPPRSQPVVGSEPIGQYFSSELQTTGHFAGQVVVLGMQVSGMGQPASSMPPEQRTSPSAHWTGHAAEEGHRGSCLMHCVPRSQPLLSTPKGHESSSGRQDVGQTAGQVPASEGSGMATQMPSDWQVSPLSVILRPGQNMWSAGQVIGQESGQLPTFATEK